MWSAPKKSEYDRRSILMAGIWLFQGGVGPNAEKVKALFDLPTPRTKPELRSALGLVSYLRDHIPLVSLFTAKLSGREVESQELDGEWRKLLRHIARAITTIRHFDENRDADLYTDASDLAIGAVLIQDGKIIAVSSRKLTPAETRYSATDREHLSLAHAAEKYRFFLHRQGAETRIHNDHQALLGRKNDKMTPRQERTRTLIQTWVPNLRHVKGERNPADFFSRWKMGDVLGQICV